jgi:transcriptional regulator with XRE-family HTH domain
MKLTQQQFGERVRQWRSNHKMSQHELAILLGISQSLVSKVENGFSPVNHMIVLRFLNKIAKDETVIVKIGNAVYRRQGLWFGLFLEANNNGL